MARVALVGALAAGCGLSPSITPTASTSPANFTSPANSTTPATQPFAGLPSLVLVRGAPPAATYLISTPGRPEDLAAIELPQGLAALDALGRDGLVALHGERAEAHSSTAAAGRLAGTTVNVVWRHDLSASGPPEASDRTYAACLADASGLVIAGGDGALRWIPASGSPGPPIAPPSIGECRMPDARSVLFAVEGAHQLARWTRPTGPTVVSTTSCDGFSVGGGLLACWRADPAGGTTARLTVGALRDFGRGIPAAGSPLFERAIDATFVNAELSRDAAWLALAFTGEVELYRRKGAGFRLAGRAGLPGGALLVGFAGAADER